MVGKSFLFCEDDRPVTGWPRAFKTVLYFMNFTYYSNHFYSDSIVRGGEGKELKKGKELA